MPVPTTDNLPASHGEPSGPSPESPRSPSVTTELPPIGFKIPNSMEELLNTSGSKWGHSAVSSYLSCPERSRLTALRIARRKGVGADLWTGPIELDALGYGTLLHALMAIRKVYGMTTAMQWLAWLPNLGSETRMDAEHMMKTWDYEFPMPEPYTLLGVEVEVYTDIGDGRGGSLIRTVRYDELATRLAVTGEKEVVAFEHKSMASSPGTRGVAQYMPQIMTQVKLWNANPALVAQHGRMREVVVDALIKTKVPKVARLPSGLIDELMEERITDYLRLPEKIVYPRSTDGAYPRMLHSCFGKYQPCNYVDLCLRGQHNLYEQRPDPQTDPVQVAGD